MNDKEINGDIQLLDVVALTEDIPEYKLWRGEIGAVVECYPGDAYEVEFVAQDGFTYALVTLRADQIVPLRQKKAHVDVVLEPAAF
jgi:hypothetical protein